MKCAIKKIGQKQAASIIDSKLPLGLFYALKAGVNVGIDNSNGQAWTEEFQTCGDTSVG